MTQARTVAIAVLNSILKTNLDSKESFIAELKKGKGDGHGLGKKATAVLADTSARALIQQSATLKNDTKEKICLALALFDLTEPAETLNCLKELNARFPQGAKRNFMKHTLKDPILILLSDAIKALSPKQTIQQEQPSAVRAESVEQEGEPSVSNASVQQTTNAPSQTTVVTQTAQGEPSHSKKGEDSEKSSPDTTPEPSTQKTAAPTPSHRITAEAERIKAAEAAEAEKVKSAEAERAKKATEAAEAEKEKAKMAAASAAGSLAATTTDKPKLTKLNRLKNWARRHWRKLLVTAMIVVGLALAFNPVTGVWIAGLVLFIGGALGAFYLASKTRSRDEKRSQEEASSKIEATPPASSSHTNINRLGVAPKPSDRNEIHTPSPTPSPASTPRGSVELQKTPVQSVPESESKQPSASTAPVSTASALTM